MIKLFFKTIALMSSMLISFNSVVNNVDLTIPNYSYDERLPTYESEIKRTINFQNFGCILDFDYDMNKYVDRESARLYLPLFRKNLRGNFYYKLLMTDINGKSYLLLNDVHKETDSQFRGEFSIPFQINFNEMGECSKFNVSIWTDGTNRFPFELSFYLSSPNIVSVKNQYTRIYSRAKLSNNILSNFEERIEFLNLPKVIEMPYYFKFYSDQMYLRAGTMSKTRRFGSAYLCFLDNGNFFKKSFDYHFKFPEYRGAVLQSFNDDPAENYIRIFYQRAFYVDQETHMCSKESSDFKRCVATRDIFFPINKYDEYKMVNFRLFIMDIGRSKTDICYDFVVRFGTKHIQETLDVSREIPIDEFAIKMKEVILWHHL